MLGGVPPVPSSSSRLARRPHWFRSLGARLLAFAFVLVLVPAGIFAVLTFSSARVALEKSAGRQLATAAHETAERLGDFLAQEQKDLRVWTRQEVVGQIVDGDRDGAVSRFLAGLADQTPAYFAVEVVDRAGVVVASSLPAELGATRHDAPWFRPAIAEKHVIRGPRPWGPAPRSVLDLATPVRRNGRTGEVLGAMHLVLDWSGVEGLLARSRLDLEMMGLRTEVFLTSGRDVIGGSRDGWRDDSSLLAGREAAGRLAGHWYPGRPPSYAVDSVARLVAGVSPLVAGRGDWSVVVAQPLAEALAPIRALQERWMVVLVGVLIVALLFAGVQGSRMIQPLRHLTDVTRRVAQTGRPMPAPAIERVDEIGVLAASFTTMAARLRQTQEDLVEATRLALVGELAAGVAHEVRTPLSVLRSSTQLLHRAVPPGDTHADELTQLMIGEIDRLERVVAGLLELARPRPPVRVPTPLPDVLARVSDFVATRAADKGIALVRTLPLNMAPAWCDPDQIYQVALNLLLNAVQHVEPNGRIELRAVEPEPGKVGFEVQDDGPGVAEAIRERIFLPFFTTRADGTGLGLALVKAIVDAHQGEVSLAAATQRGSLFRVCLPAAEALA